MHNRLTGRLRATEKGVESRYLHPSFGGVEARRLQRVALLRALRRAEELLAECTYDELSAIVAVAGARLLTAGREGEP
jgi:hypothetical protein